MAYFSEIVETFFSGCYSASPKHNTANQLLGMKIGTANDKRTGTSANHYSYMVNVNCTYGGSWC